MTDGVERENVDKAIERERDLGSGEIVEKERGGTEKG